MKMVKYLITIDTPPNTLYYSAKDDFTEDMDSAHYFETVELALLVAEQFHNPDGLLKIIKVSATLH